MAVCSDLLTGWSWPLAGGAGLASARHCKDIDAATHIALLTTACCHSRNGWCLVSLLHPATWIEPKPIHAQDGTLPNHEPDAINMFHMKPTSAERFFHI